jgi:hypothetical protein
MMIKLALKEDQILDTVKRRYLILVIVGISNYYKD